MLQTNSKYTYCSGNSFNKTVIMIGAVTCVFAFPPTFVPTCVTSTVIDALWAMAVAVVVDTLTTGTFVVTRD